MISGAADGELRLWQRPEQGAMEVGWKPRRARRCALTGTGTDGLIAEEDC